MGKTAFLFAGQGAQYTGMGKDLCECSKAAAKVFEAADKVRENTSEQCFTAPVEELSQTINTQPCVYCVDLAAARALEEAGVHADAVAGFSLGEVAALTFAGAFSEEDGFSFVCRRAKAMDYAAQKNPAGMAAVLKLDNETVEKICQEFVRVYPVNYNCPGQIVITGEETAVAAAGEALKAAGARRVIPLKVSGPFHCELLKGAGEKLGQELEKVEIQSFTVPYVTNVTAQYVTGPEQVKELLVSQVSSSVRWQQCVEQMIDDGVDTFIEIGPGKTLTGFLKKINRNVKALHVEKTEDLDEVRKECL